MNIKILGNGGAINDGLCYNSFLINDDFLIECPPDIMNSLFREKINRQKITSIYISHFHADHCFGIPFLLLRYFIDGNVNELKFFGPGKVEEKVQEICNVAFGEDHPMQAWIKDHVVFKEIGDNKETDINRGYCIKTVKMFHSPETFGFILTSGDSKITYLADTYWDDSLLDCIKDSDAVLVDLNGEKSDKTKVHISEYDITEYALPVINRDDTVFYGTHLKVNKTSANKRIVYVKPGDMIEV